MMMTMKNQIIEPCFQRDASCVFADLHSAGGDGNTQEQSRVRSDTTVVGK